jgi:hypothetical protein
MKQIICECRTKSTLRIHKIRAYITSKSDLANPKCNPEVKADLWLEATGFQRLIYHGYKQYFIRAARLNFENSTIRRACGDLISAENVKEALEIVNSHLRRLA